MTVTDWVVIPGWDKFQHYHDRRPVWIKDYPDQLDRDEYRALVPTARALLQDVRRLCALSDGVVRRDTVAARVGMRVKREHWDSLVNAGFVEFSASKPLALARARGETEEEPPKSPNTKPRKSRVTGWRVVRGSHGQTTIPDPSGTDPAPTIGRTMG